MTEANEEMQAVKESHSDDSWVNTVAVFSEEEVNDLNRLPRFAKKMIISYLDGGGFLRCSADDHVDAVPPETFVHGEW
ncbi:hypothetical protein ACTXT7_010189 [Hymenolepis weldensis]